MRLVDARTGIEIIDRDACLRLLAGDVIGRLAFVDGGAPAVLPVNYAMDGDAVVFRTAAGAKLDRGPRSLASFEVDAFDREQRSGWSVVVTGRLEEVLADDERTLARLRELPVDPWADGEKEHWMRLVPDRITGRVVRHTT